MTEAVTEAVTPEYTTLESLEVPQREALINIGRNRTRNHFRNPNGSDMVDTSFIEPDIFRSYDEGTSLNPMFNFARKGRNAALAKARAEEYGEAYDWDQRYQSKRNLSTYDDDDPIFRDGVGDDATRARKFKVVEDAAAGEEAKRAYLAGGGDWWSDLPAVSDMFKREAKHYSRYSNPYTKPGDIYPIEGNSVLGISEYSLPLDEQGTQFDDLAGRDEARLDVFERRGLPPADTETFEGLSKSLTDEKRAAYNKAQRAATAAREAAREAEERLDVFERRGLPITPTEARLRREARGAVDAGIAGVEVKTPDEGTIRPKSRPEGLGALTKPATKVGSTSAATKVGSTSAAAAKIGEKLSPREKQVNQDKWLALAQAGFTLMNTGDFGEAGSAGLAALRNSKQADLEERKVAASEALTAAKIAAAGRSRKGGIKAPTASALKFYQGQVENAEAALKRVTESGTQVEKNDAMRALTKAQGELRQLTERYGYSQGLYSAGVSSNGREPRDVTSEVG